MQAIMKAIARLVEGQALDRELARAAMDEIMAGQATPAQIGAFATALRMKGETPEEVAGLAESMRQAATRISPSTNGAPLVDTCGTGGDGAGTFNVSTCAAFVVAGAGLPVAKHGNRSITSRCGSADVLEALGVPADLPPEAVAACIEQAGIGFLFAPRFHGAMRHAAGPRRELGFRTVFNLLGPLTNPAGASAQLVGVFRPELTELLAEALARLGVRRCLVVHGLEGIDEISISGPTRVSVPENGHVRSFLITPEEAGLPRHGLDTIRGGSPEENAAMVLSVLQGEPGPRRDVVLINAAGALLAAGRVDSLAEGVQEAARSIDEGRALARLEALREQARRYAEATKPQSAAAGAIGQGAMAG